MIRLAIIVEGETEESFVKNVLEPHLIEFQIEAVPILIGSGRRRGGGGDVHVDILVLDLKDALEQKDKDGENRYGAATSLVDFYGFRGRNGRTAEQLERIILYEILNERNHETLVLPYIQMHEFEGLLFSNPEAFAVIGRRGARMDIAGLRRIREEFDTPEDINDGRDSAPSKRLESLVHGYRKKIDGIAVASEIGIERIAEECPRFRAWLEWMKALVEYPA